MKGYTRSHLSTAQVRWHAYVGSRWAQQLDRATHLLTIVHTNLHRRGCSRDASLAHRDDVTLGNRLNRKPPFSRVLAHEFPVVLEDHSR